MKFRLFKMYPVNVDKFLNSEIRLPFIYKNNCQVDSRDFSRVSRVIVYFLKQSGLNVWSPGRDGGGEG